MSNIQLTNLANQRKKDPFGGGQSRLALWLGASGNLSDYPCGGGERCNAGINKEKMTFILVDDL